MLPWLLLTFAMLFPHHGCSNIFTTDNNGEIHKIAKETAWCLAYVLQNCMNITLAIPDVDNKADLFTKEVLRLIPDNHISFFTASYNCSSYHAGFNEGTHTYIFFVDTAKKIYHVMEYCYSRIRYNEGLTSYIVLPPSYNFSFEDKNYLKNISKTHILFVLSTGEQENEIVVYLFINQEYVSSDCGISLLMEKKKKLMLHTKKKPRVGVRFIPPFADSKERHGNMIGFDKEVKYYGVEIGLLAYMNLDVEYSYTHELGQCDASIQHCDGLFGELLNGDIDFIVGAMRSNYNSNQFVSSYPLINGRLVAVVKTEPHQMFIHILNILPLDIWMLLGVFYTICVTIHYMIEKYTRKNDNNLSVTYICLDWYGVCLGMSMNKLKKHLRFLFLTFIWVMFFLRTAYQTYLTGIMLKKEKVIAVNDLHQLCKRNFTIYTILDDFYEYGVNGLDINQCTVHPRNFKVCEDTLKCLNDAPNEGAYAALAYRSTFIAKRWLYVSPAGNNLLHAIDDLIAIQPISFIFRKGNPLIDVINYRGRQIQSSGSVIKLRSSSRKRSNVRLNMVSHKLGYDAKYSPLGKRFYPIGARILLIGISLSILTFIAAANDVSQRPSHKARESTSQKKLLREESITTKQPVIRESKRTSLNSSALYHRGTFEEIRHLTNFSKENGHLKSLFKEGFRNHSSKRRETPDCSLRDVKFAAFQASGLSWRRFDGASFGTTATTSRAHSERRRIRRSLLPEHLSITQHFTDRTLTAGGDISLQCAATGEHPPRFLWERDGLIISSNTDQRYTLGQMMASDNGVVGQLNISRVRVEDGGLYSCTALDGDFSARHEDRLNVYGPPYIRTLPPIKVQSGEPMALRCPYYGYPISTIDWEYKGQTISSSATISIPRYKRSKISDSNTFRRKKRLISSNDNGLLTIDKITKEENGALFTCAVSSPSGEMARRAFEIQVIQAPELEELMMGTNLQEGQIAQITCNIRDGDTPIYFSWLKDGKKIPAHLKIVERSSELFSVLVIRKVSLEHCGTYTCIAANHAAKVNRTADLYIKVAPKWTSEPSNTSLLLGHRGLVSCSASGYPQPQVHWMKKHGSLGTWQPVLELVGSGVLSLPNGSLLIEVVSLADEGFYSCNVENGVGQPLSKSIYMSVNKPVRFELTSANVTTRLGHPVSVDCQPLGDDPIRVTWTHNGKLIDFRTQRVKLSESKSERGFSSTINFQYSEVGDGGELQCRASNPYGVATHTVHLTVQEPPAPPMELSVDSVRSRRVKLSWRDTIRTHVQYYTVQYAPHHAWDNARTINTTRQESEVRQSIELQDLKPATPYIIRVASGNEVDLSPYTTSVNFNTLEEAPTSSPMNVLVEQTENPGELKVSWLAPPKDTHNGLLLGYYVKAQLNKNMGSEEANIRTVKVSSQSGKHESVISGLMKNTRYAVTVCAFNGAGRGPFSLPLFQDTREGAPEQAPSSVECTAVSSTSLRVAWQQILPGEGGSLVGYTLLLATEDGLWQNMTTLHTELYLQSLLKYTNYTIKVAGFSNYGAGPFSYPIVCSTLQDVPDAPAGIKVLVESATTLLVSWKKPDHPNGHLSHYTVYVKPSSSSGQPVTYRSQAGSEHRHLSKELKSLTQGRQYEVWVTASTAAGEGEPTRRVTQTPTTRVVAGIASLGGPLSIGVGSSLLLVCQAVGSPAPRTVWYHNQNIITHHPRYTLNHDDSLLVNNIDQSLSGNYTCLAKNLYGSDSVVYTVTVLPLPEPPILRATPYKDSLVVEWERVYYAFSNRSLTQQISYSLTWKESNGPWQEAWPAAKVAAVSGLQKHALTGLKCGTSYSLRITATNRVGTSQPAYLDVSTLGGVPIPPTTNEWLWSNSSHIYIQLSGWEENGCEINSWEVDQREMGTLLWQRATNQISFSEAGGWGHFSTGAVKALPRSFAVGGLAPARWHQLRVTAANEAGAVTSVYSYATKTQDGEEIGPPTDFLDLNMLVIIFSSILLVVCALTCIYILIRRHKHSQLTEYRDSIATEYKSESGNLTSNASQSNMCAQPNVKEVSHSAQHNCNRLYSTPINVRKNSNKNEMYEISPYAQFAVGFRTFGHIDNQDQPGFLKGKQSCYNTETSFQMCSESEDSDSISKSTTLKSVPGKSCRMPHHR